MKHVYLLVTILLSAVFSWAQVTLKADGPGNTYQLIESKGFGIESPDCGHTSFGPHVTEVFDNTINRNVFVFHSHHLLDDDRCGSQDRTRMEIKGGNGSPGELQHTNGQTAYYRWKFKLDAAFRPSSRFTHIFQIKAIDGDAGAPVMTITPRAGSPEKLQIIHSAGEGSGSLGTVHQVDLAPFKGTWVEVFVKYKSSEGSAGTFEINIKRVSDGTTLLSYSRNGIDMWRTGASYNRPKWGVYRGKDDALRDEQVRFADFCVTESSESLCPSDIGGGNQVTLTPTHDAYVRDGSNAGITHGTTDPTLLITKLSPTGQLNNAREAYLTFNLSSVGSDVSSVILRMYGKVDGTSTPSVPIGVFPVANIAWAESTVTWNNKPATGATGIDTTTVTNAPNTYYSWDLTSYVQSELEQGRTTISISLKSLAQHDPRVFLHSKEASANPPQLVVTPVDAFNAAPVTAITSGHATKQTRGSLIVYPNPLRGKNTGTIAFHLDQPGKTSLVMYDMLGQQVAVLVNGNLNAGDHRISYAPGNVPAGTYVLKLVNNDKVKTLKFLKQ